MSLTSLLKRYRLIKAFVFRTIHHCKIKAHDTITIPIKCILPKSLRNGEFFSKSFRPYSSFLPSNFTLKFKRDQSYIKLPNPTAKVLNLKSNTPISSILFDIVQIYEMEAMS